MEKKSWKERLKEGEAVNDIILTEPLMDINSWLNKCKSENLNDDEENLFIKWADHLDRIKFEIVSPKQFAKQWQKTVTIF